MKHADQHALRRAAGANRRRFLQQALAATATTGLAGPTLVRAARTPASDRLRVGCIGVGSMGEVDARGHAHAADIVAVCDVDSRHARRTNANPDVAGGRADVYADYRRVLDRKDIDVVSVVTPDHWHVKIAIEALHAGKHVFCQKPLTLTVDEGREVLAAKAKFPDLAFTIGTQQRADVARFLRAVNMVRRGMLGEIRRVTVGIDGAPTGGPFPAAKPPAELDWERWQGPVRSMAYRERRCHYDFRWWYEYSGGKFTDWGAHHVDIALWAIDRQTPEATAVAIDGVDVNHPVPLEAGYPTREDSYNTSHDFNVVCRFADGLELHVSSRADNGLLFEGKKGRLFVNRGKIAGKPIEEDWDAGRYGLAELKELFKGKPPEWHKGNFYRCVRDGGEPVSDVASHVAAMDLCHRAAIAARLQTKLTWDPATQRFTGDDRANGFLSRTPRSGYETLA